MNDNSKHSFISVYIENERIERDLTIEALAKEVHISAKTYIKIKKDWMLG